jgi:hypothetical protein
MDTSAFMLKPDALERLALTIDSARDGATETFVVHSEADREEALAFLRAELGLIDADAEWKVRVGPGAVCIMLLPEA